MSAIGGLGLATVASYLKTYYIPNGLWNELTVDSKLLSDMKAMGNSIAITGEKSEFAIQHTRQSGIKISNETADLPDVNPRKTVKGFINPKQIYGRTSIDQFTMAVTQNNAGAYMSAIADRFETLIVDLSNAVQLSTWTDTYAKLGKIKEAVTAKATVKVDNAIRFEPGIKVQQYALDANGAPTGASKGTFIVADYDIDAGTVSFKSNVTTVITGDGEAFFFNSEDASGLDVEGIEGQMKSVSEKAVLHNIDRSVVDYGWYQATQVKNAAAGVAILDENVLRRAKTRSKLLAPKERANAINRRIYGGVDEINGYESTLLNQRRYPSTGGGQDYDTGKNRDELYFDNILLGDDKYATGEEVEMLSMSSWNMHILEDQSWMDMDGSMLHRIANKPGYEGSNYMFWNMSNKNPRENVRITGVEAYNPIA